MVRGLGECSVLVSIVAGCFPSVGDIEPPPADAGDHDVVGVGGTAGTGGGSGGGVGGDGGTTATGGAGTGTGGLAGAAGQGGSNPCPETGGPPMVLLPAGFCIDSTEVSRAHFAQWLASGPSVASQPDACSWNDTFEPSGDWPPAPGTDDRPVAHVDWCDAAAYCAGVGKRLCGKIGGGSVPDADLNDATVSQWFNACSGGGITAYPYGQTYDPAACNGLDSGVGHPVDVGSFPTCQSPIIGYDGVFDMSGNVWEWADSCDAETGPSDLCRYAGGSSTSPASNSLRCTQVGLGSRDVANETLGFRCCAP